MNPSFYVLCPFKTGIFRNQAESWVKEAKMLSPDLPILLLSGNTNRSLSSSRQWLVYVKATCLPGWLISWSITHSLYNYVVCSKVRAELPGFSYWSLPWEEAHMPTLKYTRLPPIEDGEGWVEFSTPNTPVMEKPPSYCIVQLTARPQRIKLQNTPPRCSYIAITSRVHTSPTVSVSTIVLSILLGDFNFPITNLYQTHVKEK